MQTTFGLGAVSPFSFRRCVWLCLPALVLGAVLRLSLLMAIPEAFFGSDSASYSKTTEDLHLKGHFNFPAKRRYVYPLLLVPAPEVPFCNTPQLVAAVQHTAGLAMILGIGWITGHLVRRRALWVPAVTLFAAVWPHALYYEHEMISECLVLGVFLAALAIAAPSGGLGTARRLGWFLVLAVGIMAVKPAGRPLWAGLFLAATLVTRRPLAWPRAFFLTVPAAVLIAATSGGDKQGPWLFLTSTLPLVRAEGEPYARERALLRPAIEEARADLQNSAFSPRWPGSWCSASRARSCRDAACARRSYGCRSGFISSSSSPSATASRAIWSRSRRSCSSSSSSASTWCSMRSRRCGKACAPRPPRRWPAVSRPFEKNRIYKMHRIEKAPRDILLIL